jgi:hypothetical protein
MTGPSSVAIRLSLENARIDKSTEPLGQQCSAQTQFRVEVVEPPHAGEGLSQDNQRPSVAQQPQWSKDRTRLKLEIVVAHSISVLLDDHIGHWPQIEAPEAVLSHLFDHIDAVTGASSGNLGTHLRDT